MEVFVFIMTQCTKCMGAEEKTNTCGTICLKYLLFTFNFIFWLAGGAVAAVGVWTLVDKSEYISLLASSAYSASAYVLILAGVVVVATGILGCCATIKEHKGFLIVLSDELRVNLKETMVNKYDQPGQEHVTKAVDKLHQDLKCCGSINYTDWRDGAWIKDRAGDRVVPDSCCKTPSDRCGRRHHPSNIYNVEGGCIGKLEEFLLQHLQILGGVGIGLAFIQLVGMIFTCCLYQSLKEDPY
ncbi:CD151 antigen isoform X5 [Alosa alosa]|uniref:CD151 antigen isoform X5 n=1 Tax=Alosa alosa TaxID=278164 RepID=UPI00201543B6|nr:CD151 antigen isoform X5 [Alosa alosa]